MALSTNKEKALKVIVKQIKALDDNKLLLDVLDCNNYIFVSRVQLMNVIEEYGYSLSPKYKLIKK